MIANCLDTTGKVFVKMCKSLNPTIIHKYESSAGGFKVVSQTAYASILTFIWLVRIIKIWERQDFTKTGCCHIMNGHNIYTTITKQWADLLVLRQGNPSLLGNSHRLYNMYVESIKDFRCAVPGLTCFIDCLCSKCRVLNKSYPISQDTIQYMPVAGFPLAAP